MSTYKTFLPNYYGSLIKGQQQALLLDNLYWYVADGVSKFAEANQDLKCIADEQRVITEIMYGGKLTPADLIGMVRRVDWESGKVFTKYDSHDVELGNKDFYCINTLGYVYKCLDNNNNSPSLIEPTTLDPGAHTLADGYIWFYMYKLTLNQLLDYSILNYIPIIIDPVVISSATRGIISTIDIKSPGIYPNTHQGEIVSILNSTTIRINDNASSVSGIYRSMGFYVSNGELSQIQNYTANTSGRFVELNDPISVLPGNTYSISPYVSITGNGTGASARAIMSGEYVSRIEILDRGSEYTSAEAKLIADPIYENVPGELIMNLSPIKGHGGDPFQELYVDNVLFSVNMDNYNIGVDYPVDDISFAKVGLIRGLTDGATDTIYDDTSFNNTFTIETNPLTGGYSVGDTIVSQISPTNTSGQIVFANSTHIIGTYSSPHNRFIQGEIISNQSGTQSTILNIAQPNVRLIDTDIVALINTDTITRSENSRENLQILIRAK